MRIILFLFAAALFGADPPPRLTDAQRADLALALAQYQQARAEAAEARAKAAEAYVRMLEQQTRVDTVIRAHQVPGYQLNDSLIYIPSKEPKADGKQ